MSLSPVTRLFKLPADLSGKSVRDRPAEGKPFAQKAQNVRAGKVQQPMPQQQRLQALQRAGPE
jgi:hypothetical protein